MEDPSTLFSLVALPATGARGEMIGFEVKYLQEELLPRELDLRSGDTVTHIQGKALSSMKAAQEIFWEFQGKRPKVVETSLLRGGKRLPKTYRCLW